MTAGVLTQPALSVTGLTAGYGRGAPVIRDVSLQVGAGEVVALLGANGAGKTTTLRAISGLLRTSAGTVELAGRQVGSCSPQRIARLGVAHVIEGHGVFGGLTVSDHFRVRARGETLDRDRAFEYFPALAKIAGRRAGLLSGGEQQMLALARALARRPTVLLVDELSLGLAPVIVERLLPTVREYATQVGAAVLLVEQHVQLALELADRGYVLSHGRITLERPAAELLADRELVLSSYLGDGAVASVPLNPS